MKHTLAALQRHHFSLKSLPNSIIGACRPTFGPTFLFRLVFPEILDRAVFPERKEGERQIVRQNPDVEHVRAIDDLMRWRIDLNGRFFAPGRPFSIFRRRQHPLGFNSLHDRLSGRQKNLAQESRFK